MTVDLEQAKLSQGLLDTQCKDNDYTSSSKAVFAILHMSRSLYVGKLPQWMPFDSQNRRAFDAHLLQDMICSCAICNEMALLHDTV